MWGADSHGHCSFCRIDRALPGCWGNLKLDRRLSCQEFSSSLWIVLIPVLILDQDYTYPKRAVGVTRPKLYNPYSRFIRILIFPYGFIFPGKYQGLVRRNTLPARLCTFGKDWQSPNSSPAMLETFVLGFGGTNMGARYFFLFLVLLGTNMSLIFDLLLTLTFLP